MILKDGSDSVEIFVASPFSKRSCGFTIWYFFLVDWPYLGAKFQIQKEHVFQEWTKIECVF